MTLAVDWGRKATKQTKQNNNIMFDYQNEIKTKHLYNHTFMLVSLE